MLSLDIIQGEDWFGLWVDDELTYQNHSVVNIRNIIEVVKDQTFTLRLHKASDGLNEWLLDNGRFNNNDTVQEALNRGLDD